MTIRRAALALCALVTTLPLAACYSDAPITVSVRDRETAAPIEGALVRVSNTSVLNPFAPDAQRTETDDEGLAYFESVAMYNRLLVRVSAPGRADHVFVGDHPAHYGDMGWLDDLVNEAGEPGTVQVFLYAGRVRPQPAPETIQHELEEAETPATDDDGSSLNR